MGFLDGLSDTFNSAASATSRGAKVLKLKTQIGEVNKRRSDFSAQLGASLYELTKDDEKFRTGRETLYDGIVECDKKREELQAQLAELDAQAAAESSSTKTYTCPKCGTIVKDSDIVCSSCGKPLSEIRDEVRAAEEAAGAEKAREAVDKIICPHCGARVIIENGVCPSCGKPLDDSSEAVPSEPASAPVAPSGTDTNA